MPSKQTTDHQRFAVAVAQAARTHGPALAEELSRRLARWAPAKAKIPAIGAFIELLATAVERSDRAAVEAEQALAGERQDDDEPRTRRESTTAKLYERTVRLRGIFESAFGVRELRRLGLTGTTPQEPIALVRTARGVVEALAKKHLKIEQDGVSIDGAKVAKGLSADADAVDTALNDVAREGREEQAAKVRRDHDRSEARTDARALATILQGMFLYARMPEFAAQVVPTVAGGTESEEDEDGGEDGGETEKPDGGAGKEPETPPKGTGKSDGDGGKDAKK